MAGDFPRAWRGAAAGLAGLLFLAACGPTGEAPPEEPGFELRPVAFADLPGWRADQPEGALAAFRRSCAAILRRDDDRAMGGPHAGTVADWRNACTAADDVADGDARAFFERWFAPFQVVEGGDGEGLFTGYYEPLLEGALEPDERFRYPLYRRPDDLVAVDLGHFDPELEGESLRGRVEGGRLVPYAERAEIAAGALDGRGLELLWVDDPIDKFFLEIQGSGQVRLRDGRTIRVGYADKNGRPYRAIGRDLVAMGALTAETVSMQSIRAWLEANPDRAREIMNRNPSYVFFHRLEGLDEASGPLGSQGVPLEPGRSLAVDRRFWPMGAPFYLDATAPYPEGERPFRRLVIAQDTGGAIRGPIRGDVFFGAGPLAEYVAGHMKSRGRLYILLPKGLAPVG